MDFGAVALDGLVVGSDPPGFSSSDPETKQKWYGSAAFLKQERSSTAEDDLRSAKIPRSCDLHLSSSSSSSKGSLFPLRQRSNGNLFLSEEHSSHMLSFSSPKSDAFPVEKTPHAASAFFHLAPPRNTGGGSMQGAFLRAPFTPSQWMELEHQALIYKYITANVPVPSNLLIPIRKALESAGFSSFAGGFLRPTSVGWGGFNVGFSNNSDPEPGRCRRTDGKKWRCSRDAVADQKYCERHMNRGRHRSRKPVEGHSGHSVSGASIAAVNSKIASSTAAVSGNGLSFGNQQLKNRENGGHGLQESSGLSVLSPATETKQKALPFAVQKHQNAFEEAPSFLLSPPEKTSSPMSYRDFAGASTGTNTSLRQFFNHWPKTHSDSSSVSWSNSDIDPRSNRTQLSISIPQAATSDFRSSTSSPANEKLTLSPLKFSQELDPIQMGLGVGTVIDEPSNRQANWIPISWENSMGGPLGEVLNSMNNVAGDSKSSSALDLMTDGWDNSSSLGSSPTGVLQKTAFGTFSNSSSGGSQRTENKTNEGGSQSSDRHGSLPSV